MIVTLGPGIAVNPAQIVSVRQDYHGKKLLITDVLGHIHEISPQYGESIYEAQSRILALLNDSLPEKEV